MDLRGDRRSLSKAGLPAVMVFATMLGIATVLHWNRFNHSQPAFWLWTSVRDCPVAGLLPAAFAGVAGVAALGSGIVMFQRSTSVILSARGL